MLKTLWCNWIEGKATEDQVKSFYNNFSNLFELVQAFNDWGLSRPEEGIDTPAELILKHRGSPAAYETLVCDFSAYKRCSDGYAQYLIKNKQGEERIHTLIYDRGKVYRPVAYLLEIYDNLESYVDSLDKDGLFLVRKLSSWCKS